MKAVKLKTEYLKNPLGIDIKNPRFMWNCEGGKAQSAYRLIASDTRGNILWDSGKVESPQMAFIPFPKLSKAPQPIAIPQSKNALNFLFGPMFY